jgi:uncharacterized protein DUF4386
MTRTTNARLAGFTFLFYIAVGITTLALSGRATRGAGIAAKFASIAEHQTEMRIVVLLLILACFSALVLAVTLYAITRDQDRDLAMLALICRVAEGLTGVLMPGTLMLLWLATAYGPGAPEKASAEALGTFLLRLEASSPAAMFFAVGSTLFSWLLLRGRLVPVPLAALGVVASVLLAVVLPLQLAGFLGHSVNNFFSALTWLVWLPMLLFEVTLAVWLIAKGVAPAATASRRA